MSCQHDDQLREGWNDPTRSGKAIEDKGLCRVRLLRSCRRNFDSASYHLQSTLPYNAFFKSLALSSLEHDSSHRKHPHVTQLVNGSVSKLSPFAGLVLTVTLVVVLIVRFYLIEPATVRFYGVKFTAMDTRTTSSSCCASCGVQEYFSSL